MGEFLAWTVGVLVAFATTNPADGPGLGWFTLTTISALDGLLVAFVLVLVLLPLRKRHDSDADAAPADRSRDSERVA